MYVVKRISRMLEGGLLSFLVLLPSKVLKFTLDNMLTFYVRMLSKQCGSSLRIEFGAVIDNPQNIVFGDGVFIGKGTRVVSEFGAAELCIGDNVQINRNCHIDYSGGLVIGRATLISDNVSVFSHSHGYNPRSKPIPIPKLIGANVWLAAHSVVLESSTEIADGVIVAASAVLTKSISETCLIYGGNPAKKIGSKNG